MKVFRDFICKLDSTEERESNFGNLCMKKRWFVPKREVFISFKIINGGDPPRAYATVVSARGPHKMVSRAACDAQAVPVVCPALYYLNKIVNYLAIISLSKNPSVIHHVSSRNKQLLPRTSTGIFMS